MSKELDYEDAVELDALREDAALMRRLKEEIKGQDVTLKVAPASGDCQMNGPTGSDICGDAKWYELMRVWRRIVLEANQGV